MRLSDCRLQIRKITLSEFISVKIMPVCVRMVGDRGFLGRAYACVCLYVRVLCVFFYPSSGETPHTVCLWLIQYSLSHREKATERRKEEKNDEMQKRRKSQRNSERTERTKRREHMSKSSKEKRVFMLRGCNFHSQFNSLNRCLRSPYNCLLHCNNLTS